MSVPTWERHLSHTEYIFQTYQLNCQIGRIIANLPKKYSGSYGNYLIQAGLKAVQYGLTANNIKIVDQATFNTRRENLQLMQGCVDGMANATYIYLEIARTDSKVPPKKKEQLYKWEEKIGDTCSNISRMITGVLLYDEKCLKDLSLKSFSA